MVLYDCHSIRSVIPRLFEGTLPVFNLGTNGGTLEYDCATGTIIGPLTLHPDGTFDAEGIHTPGWGGPEIEGQVLPTYRARYSGSVRGGVKELAQMLNNSDRGTERAILEEVERLYSDGLERHGASASLIDWIPAIWPNG